jgi:Secretion system C-terminal sorting domain
MHYRQTDRQTDRQTLTRNFGANRRLWGLFCFILVTLFSPQIIFAQQTRYYLQYDQETRIQYTVADPADLPHLSPMAVDAMKEVTYTERISKRVDEHFDFSIQTNMLHDDRQHPWFNYPPTMVTDRHGVVVFETDGRVAFTEGHTDVSSQMYQSQKELLHNARLIDYPDFIQLPETFVALEARGCIRSQDGATYNLNCNNDFIYRVNLQEKWSEKQYNTPDQTRIVRDVYQFDATENENLPLYQVETQSESTKHGVCVTKTTLRRYANYRIEDYELGGANLKAKEPAKFTVFPSPTNGTLFVEMREIMTGSTMVIYNATGQPVQHVELTEATSMTLDVNALPAGAYFVVLNENGLISTQRFNKL